MGDGAERSAPRILVVEDDDAIRALVVDLLSDAGYDVRQARGGREALARAREAPPELILLDRLMPEGDGTSFTRAYASLPGPRAPIVGLCASADSAAWAAEIGAAALITKPFDIDAIVATVAAQLARSGAAR